MNKNDSLAKTETDWERLDHMDDDEIDLSDIPELTEEDFDRMKSSKKVLPERGLLFDPTEPYTITEHHADGTSTTQEMPPLQERTVVLDRDVLKYFPDSESVNRTLRSLIKLIPQ